MKQVRFVILHAIIVQREPQTPSHPFAKLLEILYINNFRIQGHGWLFVEIHKQIVCIVKQKNTQQGQNMKKEGSDNDMLPSFLVISIMLV